MLRFANSDREYWLGLARRAMDLLGDIVSLWHLGADRIPEGSQKCVPILNRLLDAL